MKRLQTICAVMAMMAIAGAVHANVILVDDAVFGEDSVIRDLSNNMEYLALDFTSPYPYTQILDELGPGGVFEGWSVASEADLLLLGSSADIVHGSTDPAMLARAEELRDWFGNVRLSTTHEVCRGLILDTIVVDGKTWQRAFSIGRRFNVTPNEVDFRISGYGPIYVDESTFLVRVSPIADIDVSPLTLDFGKVDLDASSTATVTLSNEGSADLNVDGIVLRAGSSSDFSIAAVPTPPVSIGPLGTIDIVVTYTPLAVDWSSGVLEISSDDPDEPVVEVVLEGAGVVIDEKDTPVGGPVIVELMHKKKAKKKVTVKYDKVLEEGTTKMVIKKAKAGDALPDKHKLGMPAELYELETTAEVEGEITVSIDYSDTLYEGSEKKLKMYHKSADGSWKEITLLVDTEVKEVVGKPDSFSDFGIFEVDAFGLINGLINDVLLLNLQQGISNSLDAKLSAALQAVDDFNACNDIAAINTLEAFVAAVQAQSGNKIPEADADGLIAVALEIIAILSSE